MHRETVLLLVSTVVAVGLRELRLRSQLLYRSCDFGVARGGGGRKRGD